MTSGECFENKWFYMKYIGKYLSAEILLTLECSHQKIGKPNNLQDFRSSKPKDWFEIRFFVCV